MRFELREVTYKRIISAFSRRLTSLPGHIMWSKDRFFDNKNRKRIELYYNKHRGERCFIIANGPSLTRMDLSKLKNEITFGMNRIYLLFREGLSQTSYYVAVNDLFIDQFNHEIKVLSMPKFINWQKRKYFSINDGSTCFINMRMNPFDSFSKDITKTISSGGTVTYIALQIAYYMGFSEVVLIGLDHHYVCKGTPNMTEIRKEAVDENHFHPNYFPRNSKWQLPDLIRSENAYHKARVAFEKEGRKIYDATVDGKCNVFLKADFENIINVPLAHRA